ncbi:hypothetical protein QWM81_12790 [Streptomyces ficellus]|uniref:Cytochrome P450 n=1 Tax=Streptomyces ficellus TaxID=1977088 RepID=A0ABT7Z6L1_9ACTN|nr:hypothetical protein [Streptomyces ficellus]MDN3294912.1 hypothetical protein [Streptomyces ficellus]
MLTTRRRVQTELRVLLTDRRPENQLPSDNPTLLDNLRPSSVPTDLAIEVMAEALAKRLPATASAWCWLLHDLAAHPGDMARIRAEATTRHGIR